MMNGALESTKSQVGRVRSLFVTGLVVSLVAVGCGEAMEGGNNGESEGSEELKSVEKEVDKQCLDGKYSEELPNASADISTEKKNYTPSNLKSFVDKVLEKRYSVGAWLVEKGLEKKDETDCVEEFAENTSTAGGVLRDLGTIVHECGHMYDVGQLDGQSTMTEAFYAFTRDTTMECEDGPSKQMGGETMARGRILNDEYVSKNPPCESGNSKDCDMYAETYLGGDPEDDTFHPGDQGFDMLLEEVVQYINSLFTNYAFRDALRERETITDLDGLLTFLWYMERYLRLARTEHPDSYETLESSSCWRRAILTAWGRAWLILAKTGNMDNLGMQEDKMFDLVRTPELLEEIQRIRDAHGCNE